jgi:hypothetical protein
MASDFQPDNLQSNLSKSQVLGDLSGLAHICLLFLLDISPCLPVPVVDLSIIEQSPLLPIAVVNPASFNSLFQIPVPVVDLAILDMSLHSPVPAINRPILDSFLDPPMFVINRYLLSQGQAQNDCQPNETAKNDRQKCLDCMHAASFTGHRLAGYRLQVARTKGNPFPEP